MEIALQPSFITKCLWRPFLGIEFHKYACCYGLRTAVSTTQAFTKPLCGSNRAAKRPWTNSLRVEQLCSLWHATLAPHIVRIHSVSMRKQATKEIAKLERNCIEYSGKIDTGGFVHEQKRSTEA